MANLCETRAAFLTGFAAALQAGATTLLPPSRAPAVIGEFAAAHPELVLLYDGIERDFPAGTSAIHVGAIPGSPLSPQSTASLALAEPDGPLVIGYTSGSTGVPVAHQKFLRGFAQSNARNFAALTATLDLDPSWDAPLPLVATVPSQHMYGMEMAVMMPLLSPVMLHDGRPLFPADVAEALAAAPRPALLVTTPLHLAHLLAVDQAWPPIAGIVSATAPLDAGLAARAEAALGAPLIEFFGSTETCIIAQRRPAVQADWTLYEGIRLTAGSDGSVVDGEGFAAPVPLADLVEFVGDRRFRLVGRQADLIEIAGKRASLGDLTLRLRSVAGVADAAILQLPPGPTGVARLAAVVEAPVAALPQIRRDYRELADPAFVPRIWRRVDALPRNAVGKLSRGDLLAIIEAG